jgi:hypothetical protein
MTRVMMGLQATAQQMMPSTDHFLRRLREPERWDEAVRGIHAAANYLPY